MVSFKDMFLENTKKKISQFYRYFDVKKMDFLCWSLGYRSLNYNASGE